MDTKHIKIDFSIKKLIFFLHSFTSLLSTVSTVLYLLSFEAFNDDMYSTNMVSFDCYPGIRQPIKHMWTLDFTNNHSPPLFGLSP